jgi:hypothetical protein
MMHSQADDRSSFASQVEKTKEALTDLIASQNASIELI